MDIIQQIVEKFIKNFLKIGLEKGLSEGLKQAEEEFSKFLLEYFEAMLSKCDEEIYENLKLRKGWNVVHKGAKREITTKHGK